MADVDLHEFRDFSFTDPARQAFALAKEHALRLRHEEVGAEHILLGILQLRGGSASRALDATGVDRDVVRLRLEGMHPIGIASTDREELPYSVSGVSVLQNAFAEARGSGVKVVSTGHLLLGILASHDHPPVGAVLGVSRAELVVAVQANLDDGDPSK